MESVTTATKLSKKQRKAIAFRERKGKRVEEQPDLPEVDVVEDELQDVPSSSDLTPTTPASSGTKRKRGDGDPPQPAAKKSKSSKVARSDAPADNSDEVTKETTTAKKKNQRYILFVGEYQEQLCSF